MSRLPTLQSIADLCGKDREDGRFFCTHDVGRIPGIRTHRRSSWQQLRSGSRNPLLAHRECDCDRVSATRANSNCKRVVCRLMGHQERFARNQRVNPAAADCGKAEVVPKEGVLFDESCVAVRPSSWVAGELKRQFGNTTRRHCNKVSPGSTRCTRSGRSVLIPGPAKSIFDTARSRPRDCERRTINTTACGRHRYSKRGRDDHPWTKACRGLWRSRLAFVVVIRHRPRRSCSAGAVARVPEQPRRPPLQPPAPQHMAIVRDHGVGSPV